jgi:unsaturated rhamnogalacturonyl hydrolase
MDITLKTICVMLVFALVIPAGCQTGKENKELPDEQLWSVRMANSVIKRYPHLTDMDFKFHGRKKPKWQYDIAMVAQAINRLGSIDQVYANYMKDYMDYLVKEDGTIIYNYKLCDYNLDKINPGNNLILLYERTGEERYLMPVRQLVTQLKGQPHIPDGGFWHKAVYPHQMWLDGVYMSSPFMARRMRRPGTSRRLISLVPS